MHLDPEVTWFLITTAILVIIGVPRIRRTVWLPRELEFEELPADRLTPDQAAFLGAYDQKVAALQYQTFKTFRVTNMLGHNLIRVYLSSADPAKCAVTAVSSKNKALFTSYVEFATRYADGTRLVVNNNRSSGIFNDMPGNVIRRYPGLKDVLELKRRHDREAETLRERGVVFYNPANYFDDFRDFHRKYVEYQASKGLLHWDASANVYRATSWTALRGIRNYLNPFGDRSFSFLRFALGVAIGAGTPILVRVDLPLRVWLAVHAGPFGIMAGMWLPLAAYAAAGALVGLLFSRRTFVWALLLGTLPSRFVFGAAEVGYSLVMAAIADVVGRASNRRKNIL